MQPKWNRQFSVPIYYYGKALYNSFQEEYKCAEYTQVWDFKALW